ncbi:MAG: SGNH/GDSL hydrolase family protein [Planctomycetes bacterium]|nr:SGNH/GDSL hydrolase family protein [Planctomycetota bacterium]
MRQGSRPKRRGRRRRALALLLGLVLALALIELGSWALISTGFLSASVPTYGARAGIAQFWGDLSPAFGVWHPPNVRFEHRKSCFDVVYTSNSFGARDVERRLDSELPRVVVLGDSFVEGYGVELEARMSNVLEHATGVPHLNFGTSGCVGSTHAYALYTGLACRFRHDAVIAGILPENDFDDDVPIPGRYQAYWAGEFPDYELRYSLPDVAQSWYRADTGTPTLCFWERLGDYSYAKNAFEFGYAAFKQWRTHCRVAADVEASRSRFVRYSRAEFQRLRHSYEQLARAASPRPVVLFTIPRLVDFAVHAATGRSPLDDDLTAWADTIANVRFVPLLPLLRRRHTDELAELFLPCDEHWSPAGHRAAAAVLLAEAGDFLGLR